MQSIEPIATKHVLIHANRIAYGIYGTGLPVVLLHGTPSSSLIWRRVIPCLTEAGFKVHVFDLLGYGVSERPWDPSIDTSITGQVTILEGMLDHWGLDTFHLVAHDIGGGIAQRFGVYFPGRLRSLTLIDVVSFDSYPSQRTKEQMDRGLETLLAASDRSHRSHFREWLLSAVHDKQKFANTSLETFVEYISGAVGQGSLFQHQVRHYNPVHTMEISDRLHELGKIPVKLIWGADDAWQAIDWANRLNMAIPNSDLEILDSCGHFSPEDQPERLASTLVTFIHSSE